VGADACPPGAERGDPHERGEPTPAPRRGAHARRRTATRRAVAVGLSDDVLGCAHPRVGPSQDTRNAAALTRARVVLGVVPRYSPNMTKAEFIKELSGILNYPEDKIVPATKLESIETWDSTAALGVIAVLEGTVGVEIQPDQVAECKTVQDLMNLAKGKLD
jgi:acyl carrier protein